MATEIIEVTDEDFETEVLEEALPVLVDFWMHDCEPCAELSPVFKSLAKEFDGQVKFVKANADDCVETTGEYGIEGYPSLQLFVAGEFVEEVAWVEGLPTKDEIRDFLTGHLEGGDDDEEGEEEEEEEE